jgi:glycine/D-amino acid oxidase-like deaminating enzyme/nitrite reductase/ring-hydroxylating ferredoxin subunit
MGRTSIWERAGREHDYPAFHGEDAVDVAIVGGGITGVTLALKLAEAGRSVALLEAGRLGQGSTGRSTGNLYVTVSSGLQQIHSLWGEETTRLVTESRRAALDYIAQAVERFGIGCAFQYCPLYWYATSTSAQAGVELEYETMQRIGLPVHLVDELPLMPLQFGPALRLEQQAQFHPLCYVRELAAQAHAKGALLYEQSAVLAIESDSVRTGGGKLIARDIVLASHTPKGLGLVQAEMLPYREYGIAMRLDHADACPPGIFWGKGDERHSVRGLHTDGEDYLIVVGESHKTGQHEAAAALSRLELQASRRFDLRRADYAWSAQNYQSADLLPYIGRGASGHYVATGFGTDGLVYGTLAALILADLLAGTDNRFSELYRASRFAPLKGGKGMLEESLGMAKSLFKDYLSKVPGAALSELPKGTGMIAEIGGERLALYRDAGGELYALSPVCTHMKCMVHWNSVEKSWDCPCHGSRFAPDGSVLEGPALKPLTRKAPGTGRV